MSLDRGNKTNSVYFMLGLHSVLHHLQHLRAIKSDAEIALMKKAGQIAAESFKKVKRVIAIISIL